MIALRPFALFSFLALLTGCAHYICPAPGEPKFNNHSTCWYGMKVVDYDHNTGLVTATISESVGGAEVDHKKQYHFFVRDLPKGMTPESIKGKDLLFASEEHSPYLEPFVFPKGSGSTH